MAWYYKLALLVIAIVVIVFGVVGKEKEKRAATAAKAALRLDVASGTLSQRLSDLKGREVFVRKLDGTFDQRPNDLEELVRDWYFRRQQILLAHRRGDLREAAIHRAEFERVNEWLKAYAGGDVDAMMTLVESSK